MGKVEDNFTPEEIENCKRAMAKPAPRDALAFISSHRVIAELDDLGINIYLDRFDGVRMRDNGRKMIISGSWPLYRAGMIDRNCNLTDAGRKMLSEIERDA